jgi:hypothetical protein
VARNVGVLDYLVPVKINRGKLETSGALAGHYRVGKTYSPPFMAMDQTVLVDWVREDLPDLVWPGFLIGLGGEDGLNRFIGWQQRAHTVLESAGIEPAGVLLDGRFTSLETTRAELRQRVVDALSSTIEDADVLPDPLLAVLRLYDELPGRWLLVDPWPERDLAVSLEDARSMLTQSIVACVGDGHREAMLKFVGITWAVITKKFRADSATIEMLKTYPRDPSTVGAADSVVRASFGASKGAEYYRDPALRDRHRGWAELFWRSNWRLTPCLLREDPEPAESGSAGSGGENDVARDHVVAVHQLYRDFLDGFFRADLDLHEPAQHEVIGGLITRAVRSTVAYLRSPHLWSGEYGSGLTRLLAETEITVSWLAQGGTERYAQYQAYGRGKAKLMKAHMVNLAGQFNDAPPEMLTEAIEHLNQGLGGDWGEEFVTVNLDSTFSGKTVRTMANETGLVDLYRHIYQSASGVTHGEWWAVQDYAMQRCMNPLHRFHWVLSMEPVGGNEALLAEYWVTKLAELVGLALDELHPEDSKGTADDAADE